MQFKKIKLIALLSCGLLISPINAKNLIGQDLKVFNQATVAISQHNWVQAEKLLSGLHSQFPQNNFVSNNLAVIYFNQGRLDEAQELLSDIIRSTESTRTAFENLQTLYGYSAAKAYSKGLNLLKPIELPSMIVRSHDRQKMSTNVVAENNIDVLQELEPAEQTTSNDMVAMLNSEPSASVQKPVEEVKKAPEPRQNNAQPVIETPLMDEQDKTLKPKAEKVVASVQDKTVLSKPVMTSEPETVIEQGKEKVKETLSAKLDSWAKAWSDGDVKAYIEFYSPSYSPRGKSRKAWLKNRRSRVKPSKKIQIKISKQEVFVNKNKTQANILFEQKYRSKNYQDKVKKRITWVKRKGEWMIVKEVIIKTL